MEFSEPNNALINPDLPYLTRSLPGIGGDIKTIPADFFVEEIPLYECSGQGTHTYLFVQKKNMTTQNLIEYFAKHLGIRKMDIGYAGRKDSRAVTRQWISIEHIDPAPLKDLETKNIKILDIRQHSNKLKVGHLQGNRFVIRLRNLSVPTAEALSISRDIMDILSTKGVPNYFGTQRFGYRGDSHLLGYAIIKNDPKEFFDTLLGKPEMDPDDEFIKARILYEQGEYEAAMYEWNSAFSDYRRLLRILIDKKGNLLKVFRQYDRRMINLMVSAWQSDLFNRVLAKRMPDIDKLLEGDMACKHINGACFPVENAAIEQPRCDAFEISPTGPLIGGRMTGLTGPAGDTENPLLEQANLTDDDFGRLKKYGALGGRRPLRFRPENVKIDSGTDEHGDYLELHFDLPSGCYATILLREITKH